jgi:hypothetical protein
MKGQSLRRGNYEYATTRVKAKKASLLTKDNYPKLLMMDLNEIGRFMGETKYKVEMTELAARYSGVDLIELGFPRTSPGPTGRSTASAPETSRTWSRPISEGGTSGT